MIEDESNHHSAEQESLSEQERFERTEITFTMRKNEGHMPSGLDGRSFPVGRQAGSPAVRQTKILLF